MSIGTRAATCSSCGKRLTRKHWYYRNGKYYCKKRCWVTEQEKAAKDKETKAAGEKPQQQAQAPEKPAAASPADKDVKAPA